MLWPRAPSKLSWLPRSLAMELTRELHPRPSGFLRKARALGPGLAGRPRQQKQVLCCLGSSHMGPARGVAALGWRRSAWARQASVELASRERSRALASQALASREFGTLTWERGELTVTARASSRLVVYPVLRLLTAYPLPTAYRT